MSVSCAVVGQSNTIIGGGFVDRLRQRGTVAVDRLGRIGASPSILAPMFMSDQFLAGCDYCLLDFCVVDLSAVQDGAYSIGSSLLWVEWACHQARVNGCVPILVMIPRELDMDGPPPLAGRYRALARRLGCPFLDVRDIVMRLRGATGASVASLYLDAAHPGELVSEAMAAVLERFMVAGARRGWREARFRTTLRRVERLALAGLTGFGRPVCRSNALLPFRGVEVMREGVLRVPTGRFAGLIGVLVNAACCTHDVAFTGSRRLVKQLTLRPYSRTAFEARLVPINAALGDDDGFLTVAPSDPGEMWEEATMQAAPAGIMPYRIEMAEILVERGREPVAYAARVPADGADLDLSGLL